MKLATIAIFSNWETAFRLAQMLIPNYCEPLRGEFHVAI